MTQNSREFSLGPLTGWVEDCKEPIGRVLLIHGISEHSGRHLNTVRALNKAKLQVVRFDLRGAGKSGGRRQWVERFEDYIEDATTILNWCQGSLAPLPTFVLGHSLGGAIAIPFVSRYQQLLQGLVLSAPAYEVGRAMSRTKIAIGKFLARFLPTLVLQGKEDFGAISRISQIVEEYRHDPLCYHGTTLQLGTAVLNFLPTLPGYARRIAIPTLVVHGSADRVIKLEGSYKLLSCFSAADKTLHVIPGAYHELHNDLVADEYFQLITRWLLDHVSPHLKAGLTPHPIEKSS